MGVGIGTLYLRFPTRDALIEAVYRNKTAQLMDAAMWLGETRPTIEALREWLLLFIDYLATKYGMSAVFSSVAGGASALYAGSGDSARDTIIELVDPAGDDERRAGMAG